MNVWKRLVFTQLITNWNGKPAYSGTSLIPAVVPTTVRISEMSVTKNNMLLC